MDVAHNTLVRSLGDMGVAVWFGGSLMGALGLSTVGRHRESPTGASSAASSAGNGRSLAAVVAIGAHLVGEAGLMLMSRARLLPAAPVGPAGDRAVRTLLTSGALASTAYSAVLGAHLATAPLALADGSIAPGPQTPRHLARTRRQLRILQGVTSLLTGALIVLRAKRGEQHPGAPRPAGRATPATSGRARTFRTE